MPMRKRAFLLQLFLDLFDTRDRTTVFIILHSHNSITIPIIFQILVRQHQKTMAVMMKTIKTSA